MSKRKPKAKHKPKAKTDSEAEPVPKHIRDSILGHRVRALAIGDSLYHYCSAEKAVKIFQSGSIRFSDLNGLNDAEEGVWGYRVFAEAKQKISNRTGLPSGFPNVSDEFLSRLDSYWQDFQSYSSPFVACFSLDGDSLSQWRAYADDGRGLAIGFSGSCILSIPCRNVTVCYDADQQLSEMVEAIGFVKMELDGVTTHYGEEEASLFELFASHLVGCSVAFKNPAFRDEHEVRSIHLVSAKMEEDGWTLMDEGGRVHGKNVPGGEIGFESRRGRIVGYLDLPFSTGDKANAISEIVLGPKSEIDERSLNFLLGNLGYGLPRIRRAGVAYR